MSMLKNEPVLSEKEGSAARPGRDAQRTHGTDRMDRMDRAALAFLIDEAV
jgi:hypothetical protein